MDDRHEDQAAHAVQRPDGASGGVGAPVAPSTGADGGLIVDLDQLDGAVIAGRYRVVQVISLGSNTVIVDAHDLRAPDPALHPVTVKVVRPELVAREDFRRKFEVLADLTQALTHPNISAVLDWGELEVGPPEQRESTVFWVVDAFGGGSLRDLLDRGRTLSPGQALVVGLEACRALDAAHQRGLFHTELTPSKMVFGADRRLRLVDFGMARLLAEDSWADPANVPTHVARYASPEQAIGLPIDAKTDVYALALVLVEAVTGEVPFAADSTVATLAGRVDRLLPVSADLGALAAILERAARPEAEDRYSAAELGRALVQVAGKLPRPEPIPVLSTGMLDSTGTGLRRPTDPTGGVDRPEEHSNGVGAAAAGVAAGAAVAGAAVAEAPTDSAAAVGSDVVASEHPDIADVAVGGASDPAELDGTATEGSELPGDADDAGALVGSDVASPEDGEQRDVERADVEQSDVEQADAEQGDVEQGDVEQGVQASAAVVAGDDLHFTDEFIASSPPPSDPSTVPMPATVVHAESEPPALYDDAPKKRRKGPIVLIALVLIAGLAALGYAATLLFQPNSFTVPVLAGQPVDRALNQIAGNGWEIVYEFERSDSFPEPEQVIRTEPEPGAEVEEGEPFLIVLSEGPEFRLLPEVSEATFEDAATQLAALGLNAAEASDRVFSETIPVGSVVSWQVIGNATLVAGDQILPGETVQLTLSQGPEPRGVPPLGGLSLDGAVQRAAELQLQVVSGDGVFSADVPEGLVVSQSPAEGEALERDGTITVQLSLGPDVVPLPDLDGLTFTEAQTVLDDAGYVVGRLLGTTDGVFVELTINGEEVPPGTEFPRGTVVDVIFL